MQFHFLILQTPSDQKSELTSATKYFREAKNDAVAQVKFKFLYNFSNFFFKNKKLVDDEARLITRQDELERKLYNVQLKGLSLLDTLDVLLVNFEKDAEILKKDFGISDKRYWWVKIQAYAKKNAWTQLLEFGKKPTSPIGYEVRKYNCQEK